MRRDIGNIQSALVDAGRAQWLTEDTISSVAGRLMELDIAGGNNETVEGSSAADDELKRAAQAVRQLVLTR